MRKNQGITLVALIITIVVLIILVSVVLKSVFKNRMIDIAIEGTENYADAQYKELDEFYKLLNRVDIAIKGGNHESNNSEELEQLKLKYKELENQYINYKKRIVTCLNKNSINASIQDSLDTFGQKINSLPEKNFSNGASSEFIKLSEGLSSRYVQQVNATSIPDYEQLSTDNFVIINKQMTYTGSSDRENIVAMSKSYDPQTGILTLGKQKSYVDKYTFWNIYDVYVFENSNSIQTPEFSDITSSIENIKLSELKDKFEKLLNEYTRYKDTISGFTIKNDIDTSSEDSLETIEVNINNIARKNYFDGINSKFIRVAENVSSRYNQTINISNLPNYKNLTISDIIIVNKQMTYVNTSDREDILVMSKSYDSQTGILTFGKQKSYGSTRDYGWTFWNDYDVYVLQK